MHFASRRDHMMMTQAELSQYAHNAFEMAVKCTSKEDRDALVHVAWLFHMAAMSNLEEKEDAMDTVRL